MSLQGTVQGGGTVHPSSMSVQSAQVQTPCNQVAVRLDTPSIFQDTLLENTKRRCVPTGNTSSLLAALQQPSVNADPFLRDIEIEMNRDMQLAATTDDISACSDFSRNTAATSRTQDLRTARQKYLDDTLQAANERANAIVNYQTRIQQPNNNCSSAVSLGSMSYYNNR